MAEFILKDQYGKEKVFDHDKIFVQGTDGELVQFTEGTGDVPAVVQALEVTQNGTYTPPEGVDGYSPVTVNIDPTKITLLKEQEMAGFALDAEFGYCKTDTEPAFAITNGEKYFVAWDGVTYETTAVAADSFAPGAVLIGNGTLLGLPGNDEPFAIGYVNGMVMYVAFTDPSESHIIGIQQNAVKEIALQDKTITENGEYTADEGFDGLGRVLVEIAAGSGGNFKYKEGYQTPSSSTGSTFYHGCGVVPDVIFVTSGVLEANYITFAIGFSKAMIEKTSGGIKSLVNVKLATSTSAPTDANGFDADTVSDTYAKRGGIRNVNASNFTLGGSTGYLKTSNSYRYYILYGLTESE